MNLAEAKTALAEIADRYKACEACDLSTSRTTVVVGDTWVRGAEDVESFTPILVVGEAPGRVDDQVGSPFQGPAGEILRKMLVEAGVTQAVLTTVVACRPSSNASPDRAQVAACMPRFADVFTAVEPAGILIVGKSTDSAMPDLESLGLPTASIIHPSWLQQNGYPNTRTKTKYDACVGTIRKLVLQMKAASSDAAPTHQCRTARIGDAVCGDERIELRACVECARMEDPWARKQLSSAA